MTQTIVLIISAEIIFLGILHGQVERLFPNGTMNHFATVFLCLFHRSYLYHRCFHGYLYFLLNEITWQNSDYLDPSFWIWVLEFQTVDLFIDHLSGTLPPANEGDVFSRVCVCVCLCVFVCSQRHISPYRPPSPHCKETQRWLPYTSYIPLQGPAPPRDCSNLFRLDLTV